MACLSLVPGGSWVDSYYYLHYGSSQLYWLQTWNESFYLEQLPDSNLGDLLLSAQCLKSTELIRPVTVSKRSPFLHWSQERQPKGRQQRCIGKFSPFVFWVEPYQPLLPSFLLYYLQGKNVFYIFKWLEKKKKSYYAKLYKMSISISKILLEHNYVHSFVY